jgi:hypothetical protein
VRTRTRDPLTRWTSSTSVWWLIGTPPDHSRITDSRHRTVLEGHVRTHRGRQSSSGGPWRSRKDSRGHVPATVRDREAPGSNSSRRGCISSRAHFKAWPCTSGRLSPYALRKYGAGATAVDRLDAGPLDGAQPPHSTPTSGATWWGSQANVAALGKNPTRSQVAAGHAYMETISAGRSKRPEPANLEWWLISSSICATPGSSRCPGCHGPQQTDRRGLWGSGSAISCSCC